jgi:hypothetical protein
MHYTVEVKALPDGNIEHTVAWRRDGQVVYTCKRDAASGETLPDCIERSLAEYEAGREKRFKRFTERLRTGKPDGKSAQ